MFRKILGWFVLVVLIAGSICGITFGALYFDKKESTTSETGSMEQTIDFLEKELTAIKKQRQELQESLSNTTAQRDALQLQYDAKVEELRVALVDMSTNLELISKLENQIAELESKLAEETIKAEKFEEQVTNLEASKISLQNEVTRLSELISNLELQVVELEQELAEKTARVSELESQVDQLEADKLALQNEVTRLTALLAGYEEIANSTLTADFYIGDTLYTTKVVKSGQAVAGLENPIDTNDYRFDGWTIDGTTPVDVATYTIEENTIFHALLTEKHEVKFVIDNVVVDTQYILEGGLATAYAISSTEDRDFDGWAVNDEIVDVGVYTVSADTVFVAKLTNVYDINFVANGEKVATYKVRDGELIPEVETPTLEGGEFRGWYVEDPTAYIDLATYIAKSDITLTAYFATWRTILTSQNITSASQTLSIDIKAGEIFRVTYSNFIYKTNVMPYINAMTSVNGDGTISIGTDASNASTLTIASSLNNSNLQSAGSHGESYNLLASKDHVLQGVDFVCNEDGKLLVDSYCFYYFQNKTEKTAIFYSLTIDSIEVLR